MNRSTNDYDDLASKENEVAQHGAGSSSVSRKGGDYRGATNANKLDLKMRLFRAFYWMQKERNTSP